MGVDAVLLVTPYYNKCTQAGLIAHYTAAADTVPCPVIVYNVPSRTGVDISVETCRTLCEHPNIGGIKGELVEAYRKPCAFWMLVRKNFRSGAEMTI